MTIMGFIPNKMITIIIKNNLLISGLSFLLKMGVARADLRMQVRDH